MGNHTETARWSDGGRARAAYWIKHPEITFMSVPVGWAGEIPNWISAPQQQRPHQISSYFYADQAVESTISAKGISSNRSWFPTGWWQQIQTLITLETIHSENRVLVLQLTRQIGICNRNTHPYTNLIDMTNCAHCTRCNTSACYVFHTKSIPHWKGIYLTDCCHSYKEALPWAIVNVTFPHPQKSRHNLTRNCLKANMIKNILKEHISWCCMFKSINRGHQVSHLPKSLDPWLSLASSPILTSASK